MPTHTSVSATNPGPANVQVRLLKKNSLPLSVSCEGAGGGGDGGAGGSILPELPDETLATGFSLLQEYREQEMIPMSKRLKRIFIIQGLNGVIDCKH